MATSTGAPLAASSSASAQQIPFQRLKLLSPGSPCRRRGRPLQARRVRALCDDRWRTRFARVVRRYGVARLARDLQIDPTAIYQWIRGNVSPRPDKAIIIIALVRPLGRLRLEDIYQQRRVYLHANQNPD